MDASAKVVSLHGEQIAAPGEVVPEVVEFLEEALEAARSGDIHGVVAVFTHPDGAVTGGFRGTSRYGTLGLWQMLGADICETLREPD